MPSAQPLAIDFSQAEAPTMILPRPALLGSHPSNWNGVHCAHYRQPSWELPEISTDQHIIYIPAANQPARVEVALEGRCQEVTFNLAEYANACFGILPANLAYKLCWNIEVEFFHFYIEPSFLAQIAHESVNPDRVELLLDLKKFDALIYQIGLALKAELEANERGSRFYADSLATALSAHLLRHYATRKHVLREHDDGLSKLKLQQAIAYINEHLGENLSLTAIADELDMSQFHFCRLFKQSMGMTAHQYLIQQRIERAKVLLRRSELSITEIAIECGFAHQSHFAKYFRKSTGVSPSQFRQL
jgi:AraC family transcriptional regulator